MGGKTGTSEKTPRGNNKYIASFVGFAPADDPQVVCIVILDEPSTGLYYGGQIASPVVRNILEDTLSYLGVEPAYTPEEKATLETSVPNVLGKTAKEAKNILQNNNLKYRIEGEGEHYKPTSKWYKRKSTIHNYPLYRGGYGGYKNNCAKCAKPNGYWRFKPYFSSQP